MRTEKTAVIAPAFENLIENLDLSIFHLPSQTSDNDRISLLHLQRLVRNWKPGYSYLEIGSYQGGTLLPHLLDPSCELAVSIDKRPDAQPDERAQFYSYQGFTTQRMLQGLRLYVPFSGLKKLATFDADMADVSPFAIGAKLDLALIDGEHTNVAVFSDFLSLLPALKDDALIAFHDFNLINDAVKNIQSHLQFSGIAQRLFVLPDLVAVIALRSGIARASEALAVHALDEASFIKDAKRKLREEIARSVEQGLHTAETAH